jgi:drug/metabolite transporter (DMT)-like permease
VAALVVGGSPATDAGVARLTVERPTALPLPERRDDIPRGILFMVGATILLASSNALSKFLVATYPIGEVMFFRSAAGFLACSALILPVTGLSVFATQRPRAHLARGTSQAISQTLTVAALALMPLAGAMAIGFSAPLWATLVAVLLYREASDARRWTMLAVGFVGVLVVTHPGADSLSLGAVFALGNAIMYGSVTVAVRGMAKTESPRTLLMWQMATMTVCHAGLLLFGCRWPNAADAALLVALGLSTAGAQYLWTRALALAPATAVSPFYYLMLVWGMVLGFLVWGEMPDASLLVGSAIVIGSGIALLWYEARRRTGIVGAPGDGAATGRVRRFGETLTRPLARWRRTGPAAAPEPSPPRWAG